MTTNETLHTQAVHLDQHHPNPAPEYFKACLDGMRAIRLLDEQDRLRGNLVWRYASGGTAEICDIAVLDEADFDQGFGTQMMQAALDDMRAFFAAIGQPLQRVWLLTEADNLRAHAFYLRRGFVRLAELPGFYNGRDALLFMRVVVVS